MPVASLSDPAVVAGLRLVLLRLARRIRQRSDSGLTPSRLSALSTIQRHGPIRLGDLGARERIGKSSVTRLVSRLEATGFISRLPDPSDGRSSLVDVTAQGRQLLEETNQRADAYLAQQVAALTPQERDLLARSLPVLERLLAVKA